MLKPWQQMWVLRSGKTAVKYRLSIAKEGQQVLSVNIQDIYTSNQTLRELMEVQGLD